MRPFIGRLFMDKFVDIHHHIVYGVDDGARSFEDMQKMLLRAASENVGDIICTSHGTPGGHPFPADAYIEHLAKGQAWADEQGLEIRLHNGCEILYTDASPRLLKEGHFPSLNDTWNVLVEFSPDAEFKRLCEAARMLGNVGFQVIFAHVERYSALRNFKNVQELREEYGVYMQMNSNTVTTKKGFFTDRWVRHMLDEGFIDCIGTDAHNISSRPCSMKLCHEMLKARYGQDTADEMCGGFARNLLGL